MRGQIWPLQFFELLLKVFIDSIWIFWHFLNIHFTHRKYQKKSWALYHRFFDCRNLFHGGRGPDLTPSQITNFHCRKVQFKFSHKINFSQLGFANSSEKPSFRLDMAKSPILLGSDLTLPRMFILLAKLFIFEHIESTYEIRWNRFYHYQIGHKMIS